jgi:hypothetical protein
LIEVRTPEEKIAGNGKPIKVNLAKRKLTKEEIKSELLSKYGSYEELLKLSSKEISEIKIL